MNHKLDCSVLSCNHTAGKPHWVCRTQREYRASSQSGGQEWKRAVTRSPTRARMGYADHQISTCQSQKACAHSIAESAEHRDRYRAKADSQSDRQGKDMRITGQRHKRRANKRSANKKAANKRPAHLAPEVGTTERRPLFRANWSPRQFLQLQQQQTLSQRRQCIRLCQQAHRKMPQLKSRAVGGAAPTVLYRTAFGLQQIQESVEDISQLNHPVSMSSSLGSCCCCITESARR